ncbi:MAG TPA: hypothetical protein DCQ31_18695 [Bacteroidales bacterium]|nr:hypothetical protein [Bacteroidales bacterium]
MIIAITCEKPVLDSLVDERFGRCNSFYIYDTIAKNGYFAENPYREDGHGVGNKIVEFLATKLVGAIYAVEFGSKAQPLLDTLKIQTNTVSKNNTVASIVDNINLKK